MIRENPLRIDSFILGYGLPNLNIIKTNLCGFGRQRDESYFCLFWVSVGIRVAQGHGDIFDRIADS